MSVVEPIPCLTPSQGLPFFVIHHRHLPIASHLVVQLFQVQGHLRDRTNCAVVPQVSFCAANLRSLVPQAYTFSKLVIYKRSNPKE